MSPTSNSNTTLPGVFRPTTLPPLQGIGGGQDQPILSRRISSLQPPPLLPSFPATAGRPFANRVGPMTSSDENVTSTSDGDTTEGVTSTSDGGESRPLLRRQTTGQLPAPLSITRPRNLSFGAVPPMSPTRPSLPALSRQGSIPSMPLRRPSLDPFSPQPLPDPTLSGNRLPQGRPSISLTRQSTSGLLPQGAPLRPPPLPPLPNEDEKRED